MPKFTKDQLSITLKDFLGRVITDTDKNEVNAGQVMLTSLVSAIDGDVGSGEARYKLHTLIGRISSDNDLDLTSEEVVLLKGRIDLVYVGNNIVYGVMCDFLEGNNGSAG